MAADEAFDALMPAQLRRTANPSLLQAEWGRRSWKFDFAIASDNSEEALIDQKL